MALEVGITVLGRRDTYVPCILLVPHHHRDRAKVGKDPHHIDGGKIPHFTRTIIPNPLAAMGDTSFTSATVSVDGENVDGGSVMASIINDVGSNRNLLESVFPQEVWQQVEPYLHMERIHVLLVRPPSMDALEARYCRYILLA